MVYRAKIIVRLWCVDFWQASPYMLSSAASPHSQVLGASVPPPQFPCSKCHRWQSAHKSIKTPNGIVPFGIDWREAVGLHGVIRLPLSYLQWPCLPTVKVDGKVTEVWTGRLRFSFQLCCKAIRWGLWGSSPSYCFIAILAGAGVGGFTWYPHVPVRPGFHPGTWDGAYEYISRLPGCR